MIYELWDTETANLLSSYSSKEEALADVSHVLRARGRKAVEALALASEDDTGETYSIATGRALVELTEQYGKATIAGPA